MYMQCTFILMYITMYITCTNNNNVCHNVHFDFFNVSQMYDPRYINCTSNAVLI